jgi:glutathione S-transferase
VYRLHYAPNTYATPVHAVLEELAVPYELVHVDIARGKPRDPAYLALNPHGKVPTLECDGRPMYESGAIIVHLTDRHPEARLGPVVGDPLRPLYLQWLFHMVSTLQPLIGIIYYPERYADAPDAVRTVERKAAARLLEFWGRVDTALADGPYLLGSRFSAADIFLACQTLWTRSLPDLPARAPRVARCAELVKARPAVARVLRQHGIAAAA